MPLECRPGPPRLATTSQSHSPDPKEARVRETKVTVKIPRPLYRKVQQVVDGSGFNSPTDFIVYVLRDLMGEAEDATGSSPRRSSTGSSESSRTWATSEPESADPLRPLTHAHHHPRSHLAGPRRTSAARHPHRRQARPRDAGRSSPRSTSTTTTARRSTASATERCSPLTGPMVEADYRSVLDKGAIVRGEASPGPGRSRSSCR